MTHDDAFFRAEALAITREYSDLDRTRARAKRNGHVPAAVAKRQVHITPASNIRPRPVRWVWDGRVPVGALTLLGGREGLGKSIISCTHVADITRGRVPGVYAGTPRAVIIAATEDSWAHTVVPRLMAADADLTMVYRVDVETAGGGDVALSLPTDLPELERLIVNVKAVTLVLDPLLSRLDAVLDSHKDAEVRLALEPLVSMAERTACSILGLIHVNKSTTSDPLTMLMASRAFAAVARSVLFVMATPTTNPSVCSGNRRTISDATTSRRCRSRFDGVVVAETEDGPVLTGKLAWTGETDRSIQDALQQAHETAGLNRTTVGEAADWLKDFLASKDGSADSALVKKEAGKAGHSLPALQRARLKLKIATVSVGFPRRTNWVLQSFQCPGETATTETTETTVANPPSQSLQSLQSLQTPRARATTGCCEGGDLQVRCKLCRRSPTYWQPEVQWWR